MIYERTKGRKRNKDMMERHRAHAREKKRIMKGVLFTRWEKKEKTGRGGRSVLYPL